MEEYVSANMLQIDFTFEKKDTLLFSDVKTLYIFEDKIKNVHG